MGKRKKKKAGKRAKMLLVLAAVLLAASSFSLRGIGGHTNSGKAEDPAPAETEQLHAVSTPETHIHTWEAVNGMVHREAVMEDVWVLDEEAWLEPREETRLHCACRCGIEGTYDEVKAHIQSYKVAWGADPSPETEAEMQKHSFDTSDLDGWIVHEAGGHWESQVIQEAYDGIGVVGYRCPVCGEERS